MHGVTDCYFKIERKLYSDLREELEEFLESSWREKSDSCKVYWFYTLSDF